MKISHAPAYVATRNYNVLSVFFFQSKGIGDIFVKDIMLDLNLTVQLVIIINPTGCSLTKNTGKCIKSTSVTVLAFIWNIERPESSE